MRSLADALSISQKNPTIISQDERNSFLYFVYQSRFLSPVSYTRLVHWFHYLLEPQYSNPVVFHGAQHMDNHARKRIKTTPSAVAVSNSSLYMDEQQEAYNLAEHDDIEWDRIISDEGFFGEFVPCHAPVLSLRSLTAPISPPLRPQRFGEELRQQSNSLTLEDTCPLNTTGVIDPIDEPDPYCALAKYLSSLERCALAISIPSCPRISVEDFKKLFYDNLNNRGHHYVIHQHDHPQAGLHYDLRLQFSETSTVSWTVPKGLPCNADSKMKRRLAVETRVHPYWYNTVEGGSTWSGTTLVWDCGVYEILEKKDTRQETPEQDASETEIEAEEQPEVRKSEPEKLIDAFQKGAITLMLKGTRLRHSAYSLRLGQNSGKPLPSHVSPHSSGYARRRRQTPPKDEIESLISSHAEQSPSRTHSFRGTNSYGHSSNTINSIAQRTWFLTRKTESKESFIVWGKDYERSVVTGRRAAEVQRDLEEKEGVSGMKNYAGRRGWQGVFN